MAVGVRHLAVAVGALFVVDALAALVEFADWLAPSRFARGYSLVSPMGRDVLAQPFLALLKHGLLALVVRAAARYAGDSALLGRTRVIGWSYAVLGALTALLLTMLRFDSRSPALPASLFILALALALVTLFILVCVLLAMARARAALARCASDLEAPPSAML
jgi:hypothetical protein